MILYWNMIISIHVYTVFFSIEKVVFKTHSSPCERVWHCVSSRTKRNPYIYIHIYTVCMMYIAIPLKGGDVSARKCSMTPWICPLNTHNISCRKSNIILKEYLFFNKQLHSKRPWYSSRTVQHAFMQVSLKQMRYLFIPLKTGWRSLIRKNIQNLQKIKK